jgi:hypothetical protein
VLFKGSGNTSGTTALTVQNSDGTQIFAVRNDALVGTVNVSNYTGRTLFLQGGYASSTNIIESNNTYSGTSGVFRIFNYGASFSPTSGTAILQVININPGINQTGGANGITRAINISPTLTAAADWRSIEWSNNSGWGLYGAGTADNYLAGRLRIGTTGSSASLTVWNGDIFIKSDRFIGAGTAESSYNSVWNRIQLYNVSTGEMSITMHNASWWLRHNANMSIAGNLLLGSTTDGGQKLQVTGDTRLTGSGNTSATTALTIRNSDAITMLRILNDGELRLGNAGSAAPIIYTSDQSSGFGFDLNGRDLVFNSRHTTQEASNGMFGFTGSTSTVTTGTSQVVNISRNFEPTSGTAVFNYLQLRSIINQTGGANGITRGLYINPTLTSAADWRSLEWSNNTGKGIWGVGTANNAMAGSLTVGAASSANASAILDLTSTTKGFLPPRGTNAQMLAITGVAGLVFYDTTNNKLNVYDGTNWVAVH